MTMRASVSLVVAALFVLPAAHAGTIVGTIQAQGKTLPEEAAGKDYGSRKFKFLEKVNYADLQDFVVHIDQPVPGHQTSASASPFRIISHKNATFEPHVLAVPVGGTVEWPNHDSIYHNAFSLSDAKPFDLGLYKDEVRKVTFDKPGRVDVFCSIHKSMHCIILVLENPFFARTDGTGRYRIEDVPAGTYRLRAWHERMPAQTATVTVPESGEVRVDIEMNFKNLPQP